MSYNYNRNKMNERPKDNQMNDETIIKFFQGKISPGEMKEFSEWFNSSENNRKYFEEVRDIWITTGRDIQDGRFNPEEGWKKTKEKIHQPSVLELYRERHKGEELMKKIIRIAAIFLLVFSLGAAVSWYITSNTEIVTTSQDIEILAPKGSRSRITLPDGSMVWLNAGSRLNYGKDFNRRSREVRLEGEAYFNVKSNRKKPFVVQTSHLDVKAYGTVFNVKAYPEEDEIVTTLVEGNVVVESKKESGQSLTYRLEPKQNFTYVKSDRKRTDPEVAKERSEEKPDRVKTAEPSRVVKVEKQIKTELYTSWKDDNWVIEGVSLDEFARMLERRYNTTIQFKSNAIKDYKFSGTIRNETLEQVLEILRMTAPVKYEVGKGWVRWDLDRDLERRYDEILNQN